MARKKQAVASKSKAKPAKAKAKTKKPAPSQNSARSGNDRPKAASASFFFPAEFDPRISSQKPSSATAVIESRTFDEARDKALDALIEIIDRCEERLWQLKQARSLAEYEQLSGG